MCEVTVTECKHVAVDEPRVEIHVYGLDKVTTWAELDELQNAVNQAIRRLFDQRAREIWHANHPPAKATTDVNQP